MKPIKNWANFWVAGWGLLLLCDLIICSGINNEEMGVWIVLVSIKSLLDMFHD